MTREEALAVIKQAYPGHDWHVALTDPEFDGNDNQLPQTVTLIVNIQLHESQVYLEDEVEDWNQEEWLIAAATLLQNGVNKVVNNSG